MNDVAKIVKRRLLEFESNNITNNFDIRDYEPMYQNIVLWIDEIDFNLNEALEQEFGNNLQHFIKTELIKWFNKVDVAGSTILKTIQFKMLPDSTTLTDIVLQPENNEFIPVLNDFMNKRDYHLIFFKVGEQNIHIVYADKVGVPVIMDSLESNPDCDGYIYHLTPERNITSIIENGFIPTGRDNNYGITYPKRIYFMPFKKEALDYQALIRKEHQSENLALFALPIGKLKNIEFFLDPLTRASRGIYTETKINFFDEIKYEVL